MSPAPPEEPTDEGLPSEPEAQPAEHDDAGLDLARTLARATARSSPARRKAARRGDRPRTPAGSPAPIPTTATRRPSTAP